MSTDKTYNGWTNYATWRVNLEVLGDINLRDIFRTKPEVEEVVEHLDNWLDEILQSYTSPDGSNLALDYARFFVSDVNYHEIAEHLIDVAEYEEEDDD
jgi:hypothetical protein